jgi:integrase
MREAIKLVTQHKDGAAMVTHRDACDHQGVSLMDSTNDSDGGKSTYTFEKTSVPGVFRRGGKYAIVYRLNGKQKWESGFRTLDEARRAKATRTADIARGEFQERSRVTLHEFAREWVKRHHGRGRRGFRERTRKDYERQLEQYCLMYFSPRVRLTEITPQHIAKFISWLCDGRAQAVNHRAVALAKAREAGEPDPAPLSADARREFKDTTIRGIIAPLRGCLAAATREGLIRSNPARDADLPHRPTIEEDEEEQAKALTTEQLAMFLRVVDVKHRLMFRLVAATGLRVSELLGLQWRHLHLDGSSPHIKVRRRIVDGEPGPLKSKYARRSVPLSFELVRALRDHHALTEWPRAEDPVFATRNGTALRPNNLMRRTLKPAAEEAGAPWAGFHTFRHTCASLLIHQGRNIVQVQRWLGHHSAAFTLSTYAHLMNDDLGDALEVDALEAEIASNGSLTSATSTHDNAG